MAKTKRRTVRKPRAKKQKRTVRTVEDIEEDLGLDYESGLPPLEYFVGLEKGRQFGFDQGFYEGREKGLVELAEYAKPKFQQWAKQARNTLSNYQNQVKGDVDNLISQFNSELHNVVAGSRDTLVQKFLQTLTGAERGVLVRKKATGEPIKIEPTVEELFKPTTKYFRSSVYNPGRTGADHFRKATKIYSDWENHLRGKPRQFHPGVPIETLADSLTKYEASYPRYRTEGERGTGEVVGVYNGEEVLLTPLSTLEPGYIMDELKNRPLAVREFKPRRPKLHLDIEAPLKMLEDMTIAKPSRLAPLPASPFDFQPQTPLAIAGPETHKSRSSRRRASKRRSKQAALEPKQLKFGEVEDIMDKGKEKLTEIGEGILDDMLNTTDEVPDDVEAYNYLMGELQQVPSPQVDLPYSPERVKEIFKGATK